MRNFHAVDEVSIPAVQSDSGLRVVAEKVPVLKNAEASSSSDDEDVASIYKSGNAFKATEDSDSTNVPLISTVAQQTLLDALQADVASDEESKEESNSTKRLCEPNSAETENSSMTESIQAQITLETFSSRLALLCDRNEYLGMHRQSLQFLLLSGEVLANDNGDLAIALSEVGGVSLPVARVLIATVKSLI